MLGNFRFPNGPLLRYSFYESNRFHVHGQYIILWLLTSATAQQAYENVLGWAANGILI